jgi:KaiC/GvpD/RAD55 family RecA-like ATPase
VRKQTSSFKQSDVTRALRGAGKAGLRVHRIEIEPGGKIVIIADDVNARADATNPWDEELNLQESKRR